MSSVAKKRGAVRAGVESHAGRARLEAWRDEGRLVYAFFVRNVATGAATHLSARGRIIRLTEGQIELGFADGGFSMAIADAEFFDGPLVHLNAVRARQEFEAVQIRALGGDSLLLALQPIAAPPLVAAVRLLGGSSE